MAHKTYLEVKEQQSIAHKMEEAEFRRQMMEKFAEDEKLEQMSAQKRRMKQLGLLNRYNDPNMSTIIDRVTGSLLLCMSYVCSYMRYWECLVCFFVQKSSQYTLLLALTKMPLIRNVGPTRLDWLLLRDIAVCQSEPSLYTEHRRAVERLIEERHAQFVKDKEQEIQEWKEEQKMEAERRAIIEQERQRLLREHATKLLGYLPKAS
jgi:hypothetical protein